MKIKRGLSLKVSSSGLIVSFEISNDKGLDVNIDIKDKLEMAAG